MRIIGWTGEQRAARLEQVCANQRLCVLPAAARGAARRVAGACGDAAPAARRLPGGVRGPADAVESFTDPASHAGTVYKACNFTAAGQTAGYGRSRGPDRYVHHGRPKTCWL